MSLPSRACGARLGSLLLTVALVACRAAPPGGVRDGAPDWLLDPRPFVARVERGERDLVLTNGLVRRAFRLEPGLACVALDQLTSGASLLRAVEPEARLTVEGLDYDVGGLLGQPDRAFLRTAWLDGLRVDPRAFRLVDVRTGPIVERLPWARVRPSEGRAWPPPGREVVFELAAPPAEPAVAGLCVRVHHELYDGLPLLGKWIEVANDGARAVTLERYESERLAVVEPGSSVERPLRWPESPLVAFSDFAMGGAERAVQWTPDPEYGTQVNYRLETPCRVVSRPPLGPAARLEPGTTLVSHHTFELLCDSAERERNGLALRRAYRTLAPWCTENPLILHARSAEPDDVRLAIDQAAEVGFELVILSFGSGFDFESRDPAYAGSIRALVEYGRARGVELGGYTLLASRRISEEDDVIDPESGETGHAIFGNSPCLGSRWGDAYFRQLRAFCEATGLAAIEHDGSYPGDPCASTEHPCHAGLADSLWTQWRRITDFYAWCRGRGITLNVPDTYLLNGATKGAMGYRETNWSLPRAEQLVHARQNLFDGTWEKTPSMGWMFVPLVEYQGGGAAATLEPLREHLDTYEAFLQLNLGAGVQACWRGPRLYDAPETRALVAHWVDWFRARRAILESDVIHLRRADARDWDGLLHVNPALEVKGLAVLFNPLEEPLERTLRLPLYYTGLTDRARVRVGDGPERVFRIGPDHGLPLRLSLPPGMTWIEIR